jgi:hypothetical protein
MAKEINPNETKNERFKRLACARVNKILAVYKHLSNLKGSNYASTPNERNEILSVLRKGIEEIEYIWAGEKGKKEAFTFKSDSIGE